MARIKKNALWIVAYILLGCALWLHYMATEASADYQSECHENQAGCLAGIPNENYETGYGFLEYYCYACDDFLDTCFGYEPGENCDYTLVVWCCDQP